MGQHLILTGRLGRDAELRWTEKGKPFASFSLATSTGWTDSSGQRHRETTWWNVTVWNGQAEAVADWCRKGDIVEVAGTLTGERIEKDGDYTVRPKIWTGRDGEPRCSFEVRARHVEFLDVTGGRRGGPEGGGEQEIDVIPF